MTGKTAAACGAFAALLLASCSARWNDFTFGGSDAATSDDASAAGAGGADASAGTGGDAGGADASAGTGGDAGGADASADTDGDAGGADASADTDGEAGPTTCGSTQKVCSASCVERTDPVYGCSDIECGPACQPSKAVAACENQTCAIASCESGWGDCNDDPTDGCEAEFTSDATNCGSCGNECPSPAHAVATCSGGQCGTACVPGYSDCNGDPADGCEADTSSDVANCGACLRACLPSHVQTLRCTGGLCNSTCTSGHSNCTLPAVPEPDDGCETMAACP